MRSFILIKCLPPYIMKWIGLLLESQRFTRRKSGNYASSQAHRRIQISFPVKTPREHLDVLL